MPTDRRSRPSVRPAAGAPCVHGRVRHRDRVRDQALDPAQRFGQRDSSAGRRRNCLTAGMPPASSKDDDGAETALLARRELMSGVRRQPRVPDLADRRVAARAIRPAPARCGRARPGARAACAGRAASGSCRRASRSVPVYWPTSPAARAVRGVLATTAPPTTSLWPLMYLVVECTTMSAPSRKGCCQAGDRKVLSTTTSAPRLVGELGHRRDVGDAQQRIARCFDPAPAPPGVSAARTAAASPKVDEIAR